MTCWITTNYQIVAGLNNAGTLALVTSYTDTDSVAFIEPAGIAYGRRGELVTRSNGTHAYRGFDSINWIFGWLTFKQWEYAKANWEGFVTIKTALNSSTFANYNAVLRLGDPADMSSQLIVNSKYSGLAFVDANVYLTRLEAL